MNMMNMTMCSLHMVLLLTEVYTGMIIKAAFHKVCR